MLKDRLSAVKASDLRMFWSNRERYETARAGFRALCAPDNRYGWYREQMLELCPEDFVPATKTLRRFLGTQSRSPLQSPEHLTGLTVTVLRVYRGSGQRSDNSESVSKFIRLAEDLCDQFEIDVDLDSNNVVPRTSEDDTDEPDMLRKIHDNIFVPRRDEPDHPEFPPNAPRFPATPVRKIDIGGRKILIKDESVNPTGSHKDRWAWEMLVRYKAIIAERLAGHRTTIPRFSMISSGSAAFALQSLLRTRLLPDLHVLMDVNRTRPHIKEKLETTGARVFLHDLRDRELSNEDVLALTQNADGEDVTPRVATEAYEHQYYDWLVYEILNRSPKHIFVPFGAGGLFANIMFLIEAERGGKIDPRLIGGTGALQNVNLYGAMPADEETNMDMLYAAYRPTLPGLEAAVARLTRSGVLGAGSKIAAVSDARAGEARGYLRGAGIRTDLSGAAGLALYLDEAQNIPAAETVLVVNTGAIYLGDH